MSKKHYIGMAGLCGYLPNYCHSYDRLSDAIDSLCNLHDNPRGMKSELRRNWYVDLDIHRDGNEYAEIIECNCNQPEIHNDY